MRIAVVAAVVLGLVVPAQARPKARPVEPGALVIVMDRSGSMQGRKLEAAKEAARLAASTLRKADTFALVTFDSEATVAVAPRRALNRTAILSKLNDIKAGGGTNVYPGLEEAWKVLGTVSATRKHVLLLSDGEAPYDGILELVKEMHRSGVTISTVGIPGADRNLLELISSAGGGRLYMIEDLSALPRVYAKETRIAILGDKN